MSPPVKLNEIVEALEAAGEEHTHYLDKRTGEIVMVTNEEMEAAEEDELISEYPDWQREAILKAREILKSDNSSRCLISLIFMSIRSWKTSAWHSRIAASAMTCIG